MQPASNNQIKNLRKLGQRKHREKEGLFLVEGERAIEQVLENGIIEVSEIFVSSGRIDSYHLNSESMYMLDEDVFKEVADTENPQGVMAVCVKPDEADINQLVSEKGLIIATDRIQDPGNMGTMIRTAGWFGSKALLVGKGSVDIFNPKVVRSTAGATGSLAYISDELNPLLSSFEEAGWQVVLLDGNPGAADIRDYKAGDRTIIVVGNEANGIHPELIQEKRERLMIPYPGKNSSVESLNAAISLAISLFAIHK